MYGKHQIEYLVFAYLYNQWVSYYLGQASGLL